MKIRFSLTAVSAIILSLCMGQAAAREFTEKGTGRTLEGRVEAATQDTVTLRLTDNRVITFKHEILTEEDVDYIRQWAARNVLASRVALSANREAGKRGTSKVGDIYEYRTEESGFRISVRNTANSGNLNDIPVNWHIVVTRSDGTTEVVKGSKTIKFLASGTSEEFSTDTVSMRTSCKSLSSCPTCVNHAKDFRGDRIEGILVELADDEGEVIKDLVTPNLRERRIREAVAPSADAAAS